MFSSFRIFAAAVSCLIILISCNKKDITNATSNIGIIPLPNKIEKTSGVNTTKEFIKENFELEDAKVLTDGLKENAENQV